jgi:DNA-binding beta-propeller fold protein YncE
MAATALAVTGQLTQLPGTAGCVGPQSLGCTRANGLEGPRSVSVSADGKSLYAAAPGGNSVAIFRRDTTTGQLTQLAGTAGCVSDTGMAMFGPCVKGNGLNGPVSVAASPDGTSVYVASVNSNAVAIFRRNTTTGELTQLAGTAGCVSHSGSGGICADGRALSGANAVTVSADSESVYVASAISDALAVFRRNTSTGELTQLAGRDGCISESGGRCRNGKALEDPVSVAASQDGKSVYVASYQSSAIAVLRRNTTTGGLFQPSGTGGCVSEDGSAGVCADGKALEDPFSVAVSADGKNVYAASITSDAVAAFRRNTTTGALTQLVGPTGRAGCVSEDGSAGACADGKALEAASEVALSPDGGNVYVASSSFSDAVAVFRRDTTNGVLTQLAGKAGCVSDTGSGGQCADGRALELPSSVAVSADGKSVYVASAISDAVAVFARETAP